MNGIGLPLHAEKAVTGRLLGLEVLAPSLSWLESLGHRDAGARLRERLCWFTNEALDYPDDCESLSLFLANLVGELEAEVAKLPAGAREAAACVLTELTALVTAFDSAPYDPLERLLAAVAQTAADYYESSNSVVPLAVWQCTLPVVSFLGGEGGTVVLAWSSPSGENGIWNQWAAIGSSPHQDMPSMAGCGNDRHFAACVAP